MITVLAGENSYEIAQALQRIVAQFDGAVERIDGNEIEARQLPDLLMGGTLFSDKRLIIIKGLADNKSVWNELSVWLEKASDDSHIVLVDTKPDKRTKTFKDLKKYADIQEFAAWTERDTARSESWTKDEAERIGIKLDKKSIQLIVRRVGNDQWQLGHALEKLAVLDDVNERVIEDIIEASPTENVFSLFEVALGGEAETASQMIRTLELTDDPYMVFGLLSSQAFQLAALAVAEAPSADIAKDLGAHPFVLTKLTPYAKHLGRSGARKLIAIFAECDDGMKTSKGEPWLLIERALTKVSQLA